jgi:hypothetical protein
LVDFVVHKLLPAVIVIDWLVDCPQHRLPLGVAFGWLAYPLAWFAFTLIRGTRVDWYPYPGIAMAVALALAALGLAWLGNRRVARSTRGAPGVAV